MAILTCITAGSPAQPSWTDIAQTVGAIVAMAVAAIALIIAYRELKGTKLAASMSAMLDLYNLRRDMTSSRELMIDLVKSEAWKSMTGEEQYGHLKASDDLWQKFRDVADFYEMVAVLVESKALSESVAKNTFGLEIPGLWNGLEAAVVHYRNVLGDTKGTTYDQFQQCAERFAKLASGDADSEMEE